MRNIVLIIILFIFCIDLSAQEKPKNPQKDNKKAEIKKESKTQGFAPDSLFVITKGDLRYIRHKVRKGETVYSITRFYNIEIEKLERNNPEFEKDGLKEGQWLLIPVNPRALIVQKAKEFKTENHLKVFYTVQPKETMYGVAKGHFGISVEELQQRNALKSTDLSVGQQLHIGWLSKAGIPDSLNRLPWLNAALER